MRVRACAVSLAMLLFAGGVCGAGEQGTVVLKSVPSGAMVTIRGEDRGRTPVTLAGLPPGELQVELRLPGYAAKPILINVEAGATIEHVEKLDVPTASLAVVTEPPGASLFVDGCERGKTPATLDDLAAGPHDVVVRKQGFVRSARNIYLDAGDKQTLKLDLVRGSDDDSPAVPGIVPPARGPEAASEAAKARKELALVLEDLLGLVEKGNYAAARERLVGAAASSRGGLAEALAAAANVVGALESRRASIREAAKALVGTEQSFLTRTGPRQGRVEAVTAAGIVMTGKIAQRDQVLGDTRFTIALADLAPEEENRLARSWRPEGPDGQIALALLALIRRDPSAADSALDAAGGHPLAAWVRNKADSMRPGPAEIAARAAWAEIEKRARAKPSPAAAAAILDRMAAFEKQHGKTAFASSIADRFAELRASMKELAGKLKDDAKAPAGK